MEVIKMGSAHNARRGSGVVAWYVVVAMTGLATSPPAEPAKLSFRLMSQPLGSRATTSHKIS